jgi:predicted nucleic acid-binding protein
VKLVLEEPESAALAAFVAQARPSFATSRLAVVEIVHAVRVADAELLHEARRVLGSCRLADVTADIIERAATLASLRIRALDAIHLATAQELDASSILVYDRRLGEAAADAGFDVVSPGR